MTITKDKLLPVQQYTELRSKFTKEVIAEKKIRRVRISDLMSGVFESPLTVWYQIQEMIHAERIERDDYIEEMLAVYNELLPFQDELSMTLFIEIPDQAKLREFNRTIVGIEKAVQLSFGPHRITSYEPGAEPEGGDKDYTQSVHYLHFPFNQEQKEYFLTGIPAVTLRIIHQNYSCEAGLSETLVQELQKQLNA